VFRIQPQEGITLHLQAKRPGIKNTVDNADMDFDYARAFSERPIDAYERVIVDAIRGDQTLFATSAEVYVPGKSSRTYWSNGHTADGSADLPQGLSRPCGKNN
jgi:glucose-6-phosphate 1-dehydrogenase